MYTYDWFMLRFDRRQQTFVKAHFKKIEKIKELWSKAEEGRIVAIIEFGKEINIPKNSKKLIKIMHCETGSYEKSLIDLWLLAYEVKAKKQLNTFHRKVLIWSTPTRTEL